MILHLRSLSPGNPRSVYLPLSLCFFLHCAEFGSLLEVAIWLTPVLECPGLGLIVSVARLDESMLDPWPCLASELLSRCDLNSISLLHKSLEFLVFGHKVAHLLRYFFFFRTILTSLPTKELALLGSCKIFGQFVIVVFEPIKLVF